MSSVSDSKTFVVSAPSGAGKTTLNRRLVAENPKVQMSISHTTRNMREGEQNGVDYYFVDHDTFRKHIDDDLMLEHAEVFGNLYGTSLAEVDRIHQASRVALLEIDVQGWQRARPKLVDAHAIFIIPPNVEALWERLQSRGTDDVETRWRRVQTARFEISCGAQYHSFVLNDDIEHAYTQLKGIVVDGNPPEMDYQVGVKRCMNLIEEFATASWFRELSQQFAVKK